jgi:hypothetical protein
MPIQFQVKPSRKQLNRSLVWFVATALALVLTLTIGTSRLRADTGTCSGVMVTLPFNDVMSSAFFCQIAEAFFSGLTNGTTANTYSPTNTVTREQMAAFITRTLDQSLRRGNHRAALNQWWLSSSAGTGVTNVGISPRGVASDGADLWVANSLAGTVSRVRGSDGKLLETWTGATSAEAVLVARGRVFVTGGTSPGNLYVIDPTQPFGAVTPLSSSLGNTASGITFDGTSIWTANQGSSSVSKVNPTTGATTNFTTGFNLPRGMLYDGTNVWVTDNGDHKLKKLDSNGAVVGSPVTVGSEPRHPAFDGTNIWVPNAGSNTITVVRAASGAILATLSNNGLNQPYAATFDGERILVTNQTGNSVSLWKATDLSPLPGSPVLIGNFPFGACSDGLNFWIVLGGPNPGQLARL